MRVVVSIIIWAVLCIGFHQGIHAQASEITTSVSQTPHEEALPIEISAYDNTIVVQNAPIGSKLEIYSVVGIRIKEIPMKQPSGEYPVNIAKGYYIVRIADIVRKISIR
ncbi:MAG: hypothetical protein Q4A54_05785 [Parabacteroides sp.]|nr:hypothetical protein [Parabacteroides sp.]